MAMTGAKKYVIYFVMIVLLCWLVYSPMLSVKFYDEDDWYHLHFGKRIAEQGFFQANVFQMLVTSPELAAEHVRMIYFTQIWWAANYSLWGTYTAGHHLSALFLLMLCVIMVFIITQQLSRSYLASLAASFLFALFPFNVRMVGNATAVVYLVLTAFFLLSIFFYLLFMRARRLALYSKYRLGVLYGLSMIFFIMAVMTQESAYGLPVLLLLTDLIFTATDSSLAIKKTARRIAPFFVVLGCVVLLTLFLTFKYKVTKNMDARFLDFIGLPLWKYFTVVPKGLLQPFYDGFTHGRMLPTASVVLTILLVLFCAATWKNQRKVVLLFGLIWIVITLLPALQVIDSVTDPFEQEEKYLFLPCIGFCILIGSMANPAGKSNKRLRLFALVSLLSLAFTYMLGAGSNGDYFTKQSKGYSETYAGIQKVMDRSRENDVSFFLYGDDQQKREWMLASYLQYTFDSGSDRPWFFIQGAKVMSVVDGRLPDLTVPVPVEKITSETGTSTMVRGTLKQSDHFTSVMFELSPRILVLGYKGNEKFISNITDDFLQNVLKVLSPASFKLERYAEYGPDILSSAPLSDGDPEGWVLMGNVYRLSPSTGRF